MKILVTGAKGQLGHAIMQTSHQAHDLVGLDRNQLDITNLSEVKAVFYDHMPDTIIHCAAYTAVDQAESDPVEAFKVNAIGTRNVVCVANEIRASVCYVSTDYVFDGEKTNPYEVYDATNPQGVYGKSKLAGEILTRELATRWYIVRTSWLYGSGGSNFVNTMLHKGRTHSSLHVVRDQIGSPTYTRDLAEFLMRLVPSKKYGIYHVSNTGACSWYDFARAIFDITDIRADVRACATTEFPRAAHRPAYSVLGHTFMLANEFSLLRPWREALQTFLAEERL